ncbi:nuclear pore complex protein Nup160 [Marchantia polymorpha subsp. ruderalis]|uniref:Uncharacterized protein n=1 Tax=Marchantia polymorpha TaxID=3197 RepID=A0A2R6XMI1_MARPO|nr:hypothetical protein MARPO_0008s0081 [Marchantia polymorpha]BBN19520.1 hypothetical protein Mp_8g11350 [Marchantia polymorpha subsp. ruderalis]|eukprot:PTQ47304.1 hypothetical protein MARPO_0008s0081 [Marchantia polymorpha]
MEVTVASSDATVWTEVAVPATTGSSAFLGALADFPSEGLGGMGLRPPTTQALGTSPYLVWRISEESPKTLELMELSCDKAVRNTGLRLAFQYPLCPFASVTLSSVRSSQWFIYEVIAITVTGVLYTIFLKVARSTHSRFGMSKQSVSERDLSSELSSLRKVTCFAATSDILCIGGQSGTVICIHIGTKAEGREDQVFELKDLESGLSRLWGGLSFRGKNAAAVKCLAIQQVSGASLLLVLHEDGGLKVWDLVQHSRQFHQVVAPPELTTSVPKRIWVEDTYVLGEGLKIALLYGGNSLESDKAAAVLVCTLHLVHAEGGIRLTQLTLQKTFYVGQGTVLACKLLQGAVWVLQKSIQGECQLLSASLESTLPLRSCRLQESLVEEQLLQGSSDACDDLLFSLNHIGLDSSEMVNDSVPSLFLRRLLQPGVRQHAALKDVLQMRRRHLSDIEIGSLTLEGLRKEIKASINVETSNCRRYLQEWIHFSSNYVESWKRNNSPYGLFTDASTGSVGLIRKNSVSVVRSLTHLEQLVSKRTFSNPEDSTLLLPDNWEEIPSDPLVISSLLRCMESLSRHLGNAALGVFHEALMRPEVYPLQSLIQSVVLILDVGYNPLDTAQANLDFGVDEIRAKVQSLNQQQRKFSLHMSQSLHRLRGLAGSWEAVLDAVCKFSQYLVSSVQSAGSGSNSISVPLGSVPTKMLSHASSQISWTQFEAARNLLLLLSYLVKVQGQVGLTSRDVTRIQLEILPQVQEGLAVSFLLHWLTVSFAEVPPSEDCSLQLSSLQIDGTRGEKVQPERLGAGELALAEILAAAFLETTQTQENFKTDTLPGPDVFHNHVRRFVGWLLAGENSDAYPRTFSGRAITLSSILLEHGQYSNLENFLYAVEQFSTQQHLSEGVASLNGEWSARLHLLGICSLARAQSLLEKDTKEKHVGDAIQCFFRAASGLGEANKVLQSLFFVTGAQQQLPGRGATAAWRLQYFEWVMQLFDQYNLSEGACQFAHAALEQVDEAVGVSVIENSESNSNAVGAAIKGRLWANVFKFSLDLELYSNAYCAIISNPDEESKDICLRRFIIVLCDQKATKALCSNELPYGGLLSRVEEELVLKAENSDLSVKANLYKLLYALHIHHHNVARAAGYMYQYALSIREQGVPKSRAHALSLFQEELDALAAAINALQLVEPFHGIVSSGIEWLSPTKRRRVSNDIVAKSRAIFSGGTQSIGKKSLDCDQLVKEHAFTLARVQLLHADLKHTSLGADMQISDVVLLLLQHGLYEMAFSLVFLFWKESSQKRELERVFEIMARKCCTLQMQLGSAGPLKFSEEFQLALTLPSDSFTEDTEQPNNLSLEVRSHTKLPLNAAAKSAWEALKSSLEKYGNHHSSLKAVVAETILSVDKDMELPLWLIDSFKDGKDSRGMSAPNRLSDPAALLRIYLDYGRYVDATYLLLEYLQASTRLRPSDVFKRKQPCGVWFPYTLVDRLMRCLSEIRASSQAADQLERLRNSLQNAVLHHFDRIRKDSDDLRVIAEGDTDGSWKGFST